ncbi:hypothetical protein ACFPT7_23220 [Acidicapsa dinghuensis]|uniref:Zinc-finger domain-containing protein n=1 Tax=Acidicapsa dinghuensis TaxID=2218256 RepID=A0ABW1ELU2_9BACT|nr:hypothetical protein [Acidicapsa dinghuensis]
MKSKIPELLFENEVLIAEDSSTPQTVMRAHLAECAECRQELDELRSTMALLDDWKAPEPNPYFLTRLNARLDEEREAAPAGWPKSWFEKLHARLVYGSKHSLRPVAAMALTIAVLLGGGAYLGMNDWNPPVQAPQAAAVVQDLQTLDNNAQLLDQLEALSDQNND